MANVNIAPNINQGEQDINKMVKQLLNAYVILTEELTFLLNHLDTRNITEIDGDVLVNGTVIADKIAAGAVTAEKINVNELSAISANLGHITAGLIEAVEIYGSVITGSTLQTAMTGSRVVINPQGFRSFDNYNTNRVAMGTNDAAQMAGFVFYGPNGNYEGQVYSIPGAFHIIADKEMFIRSFGSGVVFQGTVDFSQANVIGL